MKVKAGYLGVLLIWSTTPLAIQWSAQGTGFVFAVTSRMLIGLLLALVLLKLMRLPMEWHRQAFKGYLAAGLGIYGAMMCVYWSARYIPSGWISVLFGLTPIVTGLLATRLLEEARFTLPKFLGLVVALLGLAAVFYSGSVISPTAWWGVAGILVAVFLHSLSTVLVKKTGYQSHGLVMTAGALVVAVPLYMLSWFVTGADWPQQIEPKAGWSILYLGAVATVVGFAMFFYVLRYIDATRVALLTLITPVLALWLGNALNGEPLSWSVILGAIMILSGLFLYEWNDRITRVKAT